MSERPFAKGTCPNCDGWGTMPDGSYSIGPDGVQTHKEPTPCWVCKGKGRVLMVPIPDEEVPPHA